MEQDREFNGEEALGCINNVITNDRFIQSPVLIEYSARVSVVIWIYFFLILTESCNVALHKIF